MLVAISQTSEDSVTSDERPTAVEAPQGVLNTEPVGEPNLEFLEQYLNPTLPQPAVPAADPVDVVMVDIGGNAVAEPYGTPNAALLEQYLDPVGAKFRAMEPVGRPDYETLFSIVEAPYAEPFAGPR